MGGKKREKEKNKTSDVIRVLRRRRAEVFPHMGTRFMVDSRGQNDRERAGSDGWDEEHTQGGRLLRLHYSIALDCRPARLIIPGRSKSEVSI